MVQPSSRGRFAPDALLPLPLSLAPLHQQSQQGATLPFKGIRNMVRLLALAFALTTLHIPSALGAELVLAEVRSCIYCLRFHKQMAQPYASSAIGKQIPLRRVDLMQSWPDDLDAVERPPYTPVFILVEDGRELGRFFGYTTPKQFERSLRRLLEKTRLNVPEFHLAAERR